MTTYLGKSCSFSLPRVPFVNCGQFMYLFPFWFWGQDVGSDCISSWSLLIFLLFSKFYRRHYELVSKFNVGLKTLLHQGVSEPEFFGDLVYKFQKIVGRADFSGQFRKMIVRYKRIGYNINIMRQSACLVLNSITVNNFALIARRWVGRQTQWWPRHKAIYFSWIGPELFCLLLGPPVFNCRFSFAPVFQWCCSTPQGSPGVSRNTFLSSPHHCFIIVFICDLFVSRDDPFMS